ncbi:type III restriction/modification enzyme restriction subunit [Alteromonas sp. I10]|uniref:DEAD/DEAH box helicase family protein n=1 Tax=Alteromonas TaxID=226 RepID=UPI000D756932|nr:MULTISPECIES: DEAD/DEAH box helicase family protein [Alteromonas]PXW73074.1 type III restriction/modification enzyme restriction subunit [Alteromonas sp. I10]
MPNTAQENFELNHSFYIHLHEFYKQKRGLIRKNYTRLSRAFLDFNEPSRPGSFLRKPQFEALEIYVFLKEFLDNKPVYQLFEDWYNNAGKFENKVTGGIEAVDGQLVQGDMFWEMSEKDYKGIFKRMKASNGGRLYPNYIFALTMGTGKTILMATCIFYDFLAGNKKGNDERFIQNALVFAPDKTVLQSLREIESFDHSKVVPAEYMPIVSEFKFHYLEDAGVSLNTMDGSKFNIIVSNSQKIILKRDNKGKSSTDKLFSSGKELYQGLDGVGSNMAAMLGLDPETMNAAPEGEADLVTNQRFEKLKRLPQLGIFVDEAHHAFGDKLAKDMGVKKAKNSLRTTIDELAINLRHAGTSVVGCYNYTGTPYVGKDVLPEVVYAYSLKKAIDNNYLKQVKLKGYSNTRHEEFLEISIEEFLESTKDFRPENMLPKMAIFGTTVEEITSEVRPAVEKILAKHGISAERILVNVGDSKVTTDGDIREFNRLDTPQSEKQFILLVNKGREGWNCRSLFSVALYREPKSKVFVLQATMRCLRAIGGVQHTGHVFLTNENMALLDKELQANFRISAEEMGDIGSKNETYKIRVEQPPIKIPIKRVRRKFKLVENKDLKDGFKLGLDEVDLAKYRLIVQEQNGLITPEDMGANVRTNTDLSDRRQQRTFSKLMLVSEIARYLNKPCLTIEKILEATKETTDGIVKIVNKFNEVLYDEVIPRLFREMYEIESENITEEFEVELVKEPPIDPGYYQVTASKDKVVRKADSAATENKHKTFHLDTYCFDSNPERQFFWDMLKDQKVDNIWFTGMLTHGQSDFVIHYVDSETQRVRSYYPDFLIKKQDGSYVMVEVKGEHMIDSQNVKDKKDAAELLGVASGMQYEIIAGKQAADGTYGRQFLES